MKAVIGLIILIVLVFGFFYFQNQNQTVAPSIQRSVSPKPLVVVSAGDIACDDLAVMPDQCQQEATAMLIEQINPELVLALGDIQYGGGTLRDYLDFYDKSWGRFRDKTRPAAGNHEYESAEAEGYFDYFNGQGKNDGVAGERRKGYYSYQKNGWSFYVLNSNCWAVDGCDVNSPQGIWLEQQLSKDTSVCQVVYFHHPLFSSGHHGPNMMVKPLWQTLYKHRVELVLNGHDHLYERFAPQTSDGELDESKGIRQFVVGTGGRNLYQLNNILPNSQIRINDTFGVLKLELQDQSYNWQFIAAQEAGGTRLISIDNQIKDSGSANCF